MMTDSKIIALIQGLAKQVSAQFNGVGIKSVVFVDPNIFRFTLNDASSTVSDVVVTNFNNYSLEDKAKVSKLFINGDGKSVLFNDGTYKTIDRINNDNKDFGITTNMWIKVSNTEYTYELNHKLNDTNISCTAYNSDNKQEFVGVQIIDNDNIILTNTEPLPLRVVINYSSSNSDRLSNTATIDSKYIFTTMANADTYFSSTLSALVYGLVISVGTTGNEKLYKWIGGNQPLTYDNAKWSEQTYFIRGQKGDKGDQGIQGIKGDSAYDIAVSEESFSGTKIEWLEKLNSCLGKFSSLADLKTAYPSGTDSYKFAIISTTLGQVGIAFYDKTVSNWQVTVFASTNGSAVVTDDISISKNTLGNLQVSGFENASNSTILSKNSSGEISYLDIAKNNANSFSKIASKEYVDESIVGGLSIQNDYYNASTNTPDITTISTNGKSYAWIVLVAGTQTLGGNSITFQQYDLVIKTSTGGYLKIHNGSTSWGSIIGDITTQTDLINKLNEYAKIDDIDITSATKVYSIKHSLELIDKHRKIFMQSDSPVDMKINDLWVDTTSIPYSLSSYNGTAWVSVGSAGGTKINDWVASTSYKLGEYVVKDSLLYRCITPNSDVAFVNTNWILISGHMIKDATNSYIKRTNLQFKGNGVSITDDSANDSTIININGDSIMTGATSTTDGVSGIVPKPLAGQQDYLLTGSGAWAKRKGWTSYTPTITAVTANPTLNNATDLFHKAFYKIDNGTLYVNYVYAYQYANGSTSGSGMYLFNLPVSIDTTKTGTFTAYSGKNSMWGKGTLKNVNTITSCDVVVFDANRVCLRSNLEYNALMVSSTYFANGANDIMYSFNAEFPIL